MVMNNIFKQMILGVLIGLAVIIPGFSGAQLAIIFKMYDKIMDSLSNIFSKKSILFLLPILIGTIIGFLVGLITVKYLIAISTFCVVAFFAGMMLAGVFETIIDVKGSKFKYIYILNLAIGLIIPILISILSIISKLNFESLILSPPFWFYILLIFVGFLVSLTQLIPGLSATAILMALGMYDVLLKNISISNYLSNPKVMIIFVILIISFVLAILLLSKGINKIINKYKIGFNYIIIGLCISSVITMFYNKEIIYFYSTTQNLYIHIIIGVMLFILGFNFMLLSILKLAKKNKKLKENEGKEIL